MLLYHEGTKPKPGTQYSTKVESRQDRGMVCGGPTPEFDVLAQEYLALIPSKWTQKALNAVKEVEY